MCCHCATLSLSVDIGALTDETKALEELSRQLFLESVDLHNEQVKDWLRVGHILKHCSRFIWHGDPYAVHRGGCLELYYRNMVEWFWWDSSLIFDDQPVFLQCFDTVRLVIWPIKIVPKMTYYVSSGTLNPTYSLTRTDLARLDQS